MLYIVNTKSISIVETIHALCISIPYNLQQKEVLLTKSNAANRDILSCHSLAYSHKIYISINGINNQSVITNSFCHGSISFWQFKGSRIRIITNTHRQNLDNSKITECININLSIKY